MLKLPIKITLHLHQGVIRAVDESFKNIKLNGRIWSTKNMPETKKIKFY